MDNYKEIAFIFSPRYRIRRHIVFWILQVMLFTVLFSNQRGFKIQLILSLMCLPVTMLYTYLLISWAIPKYLLRNKYLQFLLIIIMIWGAAAIGINNLYGTYVLKPVQEDIFLVKNGRGFGAGFTLVSMTTVLVACIIVLFKHWLKKQQEWMQAEKEKVTAELQLLKAQVHPHFLFNTLNNIYSFSLTESPKTPELIVKLSSLLSYMLYDCKADTVLLEKELVVMKDYVDLERERYGNKIEISWSIEGDTRNKYIAPLIMLPFLENAFKHGTSEQLEKPWLSFDLIVNQSMLKCKVANSKNDLVPVSKNGIGIENVKKRLSFLYPHQHELKISDEGDFFVVSLSLKLNNNEVEKNTLSYVPGGSIIEKAVI